MIVFDIIIHQKYNLAISNLQAYYLEQIFIPESDKFNSQNQIRIDYEMNHKACLINNGIINIRSKQFKKLHQNIIVVDSQKFSTQIQIASQPLLPGSFMQYYTKLIDNAKKSITRILKCSLQPNFKSHIESLREILDLEESHAPWIKIDQKSYSSFVYQLRLPKVNHSSNIKENNSQVYESSTSSIEKLSSEEKRIETSFMAQQRILPNIQQLLLAKKEYDQAYRKVENNQEEIDNQDFNQDTFRYILTLLSKLIEEINYYVKTYSKSQTDRLSNCSQNPTQNYSQTSNSSSVRSLLTEKLRKLAEEREFDDLEHDNQKIMVHGNLIRQLSKNSRENKPLVISRRFKNFPQPFSMQSKGLNSKQLYSQTKKTDQKVRVHSQRTILGQINLSESHLKEKRAKKNEGSCARCEIY